MAVNFKDYYEILGVPREATPDEIRLGYRLLARQFHPDVAEDKASAEEKFKEINEAYEILSDLEKRNRYDEIKANWKSTSKTADGFGFLFGGTGFSDFYEYFFGSGEQANTRMVKRSDVEDEDRGPRGSDVEADIMVSLEEVVRGAKRALRLRRNVPCPKCTGSNGGYSRRSCETCNGSQTVAQNRDYDIQIPTGAEEGQQIRMVRMGDPGPGGKGRPGDLIVRVHLAKHEVFRVDGVDLYMQIEVTPWEAVLGAQISVTTLDGRVNVRIPVGSHSGQKLRLRGLGMPAGKGQRGDLYLRVHVQVPTFISDDERTHWEKLAEVSNFNPRV